MSVNTYINGQLHRVGGIAYYKAGQSIQVNVMPEASASLINRVYQYIGATNENYTHGFFYECVLENGAYSWQILDTNPEMESISNSNLANIWSSDKSVVFVEQLNAMSNGTYNAPNGVAYNPVVVDVQEQPWQPLEDGYSNFWFELTNDTLSPWLNFSAKNNDAVIDWGDGSGEVALDTLTPTHTYAKAGKYVVKVKGVTGMARQISGTTISNAYLGIMRYAELANEVTSIDTYGFAYCNGLEQMVCGTSTTLGTSAFTDCSSLKSFVCPNLATLPNTLFYYCVSLLSVTLPSTLTAIGASSFSICHALNDLTIPAAVATIGNYAFNACTWLSELHCQATVPPTLGTNALAGLPANWLCYVPVGYGETYKAAAGWSDYADHIVEES